MSAVATTENETPEVWTRLASSPEWRVLTNAQKVFVTEFLASGSALLATKIGYHAKSETNARVLSYELAKNPSIVAALDIAAGRTKTDREILIEDVRRQLKAADKGSVAAQRLLLQLERLTLGEHEANKDDAEPETDKAAEAPKSTTTFHVGQLVTQRDGDGVLHTGRVLAIDATGRPTQIEEVK